MFERINNQDYLNTTYLKILKDTCSHTEETYLY